MVIISEIRAYFKIWGDTVALQCCKAIQGSESVICTPVSPPFGHPPTFPSHPSRSSQSTETEQDLYGPCPQPHVLILPFVCGKTLAKEEV